MAPRFLGMAPPAERAEKKKKSSGAASGLQDSGAGAGVLKPKPGGINKILKKQTPPPRRQTAMEFTLEKKRAQEAKEKEEEEAAVAAAAPSSPTTTTPPPPPSLPAASAAPRQLGAPPAPAPAEMVLGSLIDPSLWRRLLPDEKDWLPVKYTIKAAHIEAPAQAMGFVYPAGTVNVIDRDIAAFFLNVVPRTRDHEARKSRAELQQSRETADCRKKNAAAEAKAMKKKGEKVVGPSVKVVKKKKTKRRQW